MTGHGIGPAYEAKLGLTSLMESVGCKGNGFGLTAAMIAYRTLIRPIMEYCLCLLTLVSFLKIPMAVHNQCVARLSSLGRNASGQAIAMIFGMVPVKIRHARITGKMASVCTY